MANNDREILRDLAKQYLEISCDPIQDVRRDLWRSHNSFAKTLPLIYIRAFAWGEMPQSRCMCRDPFFRQHENRLRSLIFWSTFKDDSVFNPWITVESVKKCTGWGVEITRHTSSESRGAFKIDYPIKVPEDMEKLAMPFHEIDEEKTELNVRRLSDAIGDIITIDINRAPFYTMWGGDISTMLGYFRGIENFMIDMVDNPSWLHELVKFFSDGVLKTHDEAEKAGDWSLSSHQNQAMPFAGELPDPKANVRGVKRNQLWGFMAAQEFTGVSPAMHEEFLLRYQLPILEKFGLVAYGCCEDLTNKIEMLRKIPNLRRIAVSPFADVGKCAERIGKDYILSYRPSPSDMVGYGFDVKRISSILRKDLLLCKDSHVDITLKDVETVEGDPLRIKNWVRVARDVISEIF